LIETRSWKCGSARYFASSMPPACVTSTSTRRPLPPSRAKAFYLGAVAQPAVPCNDVRDHHVVALR
jgi:hypothetical protein